jgi:hypothetical protein
MSKIWMTRLGFLVLALGLVYGGLDIAGAAPGAPTPPAQTVTVGNTANSPVPVQQQGTATVPISNAAVPTHEQGTANVDVTNSSLPVTQSPISGGGGAIGGTTGAIIDAGGSQTASAISITMTNGVNVVEFLDGPTDVGQFIGPGNGGNLSYTLALTRPIEFTGVRCLGSPGDICNVTWIGDSP